MRHRKGRKSVLLNQKHGFAFFVDAFDDVENFTHQQGREAQRGFVEHEQVGAAHKSTAHGQHLLFAARKRAALLPAAFFQPGKKAVNPFDIMGDFILVVTRIRAQMQVFFHCQVGQNAPPFGRKRNTLAHHVFGLEPHERNRSIALMTGEQNIAADGLVQAGNGADDTALARAVGPDKRNNAAARDIQAYALDGLNAAVAHMEITNFKHDAPCPYLSVCYGIRFPLPVFFAAQCRPIRLAALIRAQAQPIAGMRGSAPRRPAHG